MSIRVGMAVRRAPCAAPLESKHGMTDASARERLYIQPGIFFKFKSKISKFKKFLEMS
jgi:hypothetical protein